MKRLKSSELIERIVETFEDADFIFADGFDDAIIGVDESRQLLIYSVSKCINILSKNMTREEAIEYFDMNVSGGCIGERTPIWCYDMF